MRQIEKMQCIERKEKKKKKVEKEEKGERTIDMRVDGRQREEIPFALKRDCMCVWSRPE